MSVGLPSRSTVTRALEAVRRLSTICWPRASESTGAPLTAVTTSPARKPIWPISAMSVPPRRRTPVSRPPSSTGTICTRRASSSRILAQRGRWSAAARAVRASSASRRRSMRRPANWRPRGVRARFAPALRAPPGVGWRTMSAGCEIAIARQRQRFLDAVAQHDHVIRIDARELDAAERSSSPAR